MIELDRYIKLFEDLEDDNNVSYKMDAWFANDSSSYDILKGHLSNYKNETEITPDIASTIADDSNIDMKKFVDFMIDNADGSQEILDYNYLFRKILGNSLQK